VFLESKLHSAETNATVVERETLEGLIGSLLARKATKKIKKTNTNGKSNKWSAAEIAKMLQLVKVYGTDFSMVAVNLTTKTRDQIKRKFTQLQRTNVQAINDALFAEHNAEMWTQMNTELLC
jgi:cellobiose-specific phosphotransferase system component IIB